MADECVSPATVRRLRQRGISVEYVRESRRGESDAIIFAHCARRKLPLLTRDSDFGELAFRHDLPYHIVIYLRSRILGADESISLIDELLAVHPTLQPGNFYIVRRRANHEVSIRVRRRGPSPTAAR